ncbi:hypothetical protein, partial [Nostoc sp. 2RC]|uniref:hypothetical protein n=1 Tax=Nostoc sp. 2RC TaxID=2485484 RepID=UPI00162320B8
MYARLEDLKKQLAKDRELWNNLQDELRCETDPRRQLKLKNEIQKTDQRIQEHENEINKIEQNLRESQVSKNQQQTFVNNDNSSKLETDDFQTVTN